MTRHRAGSHAGVSAGIALAVLVLAGARVGRAGGPADGGRATSGAAQPPERVEVGVGTSWLGGYDLGSRDATLVGNEVPAGGPVVLFRTTSEVAPSPSFDVRIGVGVTRWLRLEAGFGYAQPELRTSIGGDTEQAAGVVAADKISQYVVEGAVVFPVTRLGFADGRAVPFLTGGAGYLRQLAEADRVVDSGAIYHAGGGVRWLAGARRTGLVRGYGVRGDVRLNVRTGGVDVADQRRTWPSLGASFIVVF